MKRILSAMLALCLIAALLPAFAVSAEAAELKDALGSIQYARSYDTNAESFADDLTTAVVFKIGDQNYVITSLAPQSGKIAMHSLDGKKFFAMEYVSEWNNLHLYKALAQYEPEYGRYPGGTVKEGEKVTVICFSKDGYAKGESTVASVNAGKIKLADDISLGLPVPILNSQYQVCGVLYKNDCWSIEDLINNNTPPATESPATEPPATEPPATEPPATEPPATEPPATEPPASGNSGDGGLAVEMPVDLKELDKLYGEAVIQKKSNQSGTVTIAVIVVLAVALAAAVVIIRRKKLQKIKDMLPDAEEGTTLDDGTVLDEDTQLSVKPVVSSNLRLQFRNGKRIAPTRSFTIGRAPDNDIVLPNNSSASGHHCEIVVQNGTVCLRDLGSTNGTYVNGRRIAAGQLIQLTPGMVVYLGGPNSSEAFQVTLSGM